MAANIIVRKASSDDAEDLLKLMKELAQFEHYSEYFCVDENELIRRGLGNNSHPQFIAFLAQLENFQTVGYAVVYLVPFTYDLKPNLILKELYVRDHARGLGIGHSLMNTVISYAKTYGCKRLKWDVLPENTSAKYFYRSLGGVPEIGWENWIKVLD